MNKKIRKLILTAFAAALLTLVAVFSVSALKVGNVTNLRAGKSETAITLAWSKADNATGYRVYEWVNGSWKALKTTADTTYKMTSLKPGTKHIYAVRAYGKENGKTVWAGSFQTVITATRPATVTKIATSSGVNSVKLTWTRVSGASGYRVFTYNTITKSWDIAVRATSGNTATIKGLATGKKYYFAVRPYINTGSEIIWSGTYTKVLTATAPVAPVKVSSAVKSTSVTLSWTKSTGASGYRIFRYNPTTKAWVTVTTTAKLSYTVNSLTQGSSYIFAVRPYINTGSAIIWAPTYTKATVKISSASTVPSTKAEIAAAYNKAVNDAKTYTGPVTLKKHDIINVELKNLPSSTAAVIYPVVENLTQTSPEEYVFDGGKDVTDPNRRLSDKIVPCGRNASVTAADLTSASSRINNDGGYTITLKFVAEETYFNGTINQNEPTHHMTAMDPLNLGALDLGPIIIKQAYMYLPGATATATVDPHGRLSKLVIDQPVEIEISGKAGINVTSMMEMDLCSNYELIYK